MNVVLYGVPPGPTEPPSITPWVPAADTAPVYPRMSPAEPLGNVGPLAGATAELALANYHAACAFSLAIVNATPRRMRALAGALGAVTKALTAFAIKLASGE